VLSGHHVSDETDKSQARAFGTTMRFVGWACVVGIACVIIEMVTVLPYLPEHWWIPPDQLRLSPGQFDLRGMGYMHPGLLGWFGQWGYLASFAWMPLAVWRARQVTRRGTGLTGQERVLLAVVPTLFLITQALLRLTPLKYEYPLV
jgi:hypothetical protein